MYFHNPILSTLFTFLVSYRIYFFSINCILYFLACHLERNVRNFLECSHAGCQQHDFQPVELLRLKFGTEVFMVCLKVPTEHPTEIQ